ncbi:MAG: DUF6249 domain-containing protein [bacterium]|nr:hypothetical protein [Gammaproteobacteria bacterium]HIL98922.1 hypothetical protein [Pseudomonadales bacterium]
MDGILVPIIIVPAFFFVIAYITRVISDNRIRHTLINNNASEEVIQKLFLENRTEGVSGNLKWGLVLVLIGAALGVIQMTSLSGDDPLTYGVVFIFGGAGLLMYYAIQSRLSDD